jgi:hypothetical protein
VSLRRPSLPLLFGSAALVLAGTLLIADAWFDVVTARGTAATLAMTEGLAIELPLALLCIWVAQTSRPRQPLTTAHTDQQGALQ